MNTIYITFHWYACNCSGGETVPLERYEQAKEFYKKVFGAYRFEEVQRVEGQRA